MLSLYFKYQSLNVVQGNTFCSSTFTIRQSSFMFKYVVRCKVLRNFWCLMIALKNPKVCSMTHDSLLETGLMVTTHLVLSASNTQFRLWMSRQWKVLQNWSQTVCTIILQHYQRESICPQITTLVKASATKHESPYECDRRKPRRT